MVAAAVADGVSVGADKDWWGEVVVADWTLELLVESEID